MKNTACNDETKRLNNLYKYHILDTFPEDAWDSIVKLAASICGTPISAISLVDKDRQWFKSIVGLDVKETPREVAFCHHTILQNETMIIEDALEDARFQNNPLVTEDPHIRFYAGAQIISSEGYHLGSLCVINQVPQTLESQQIENLEHLSKQVSQLLELHYKSQMLKKTLLSTQTAVQAKNTFLSNLSHQLRTPLNTVIGANELIETEIKESLSLPPSFATEILNYTHLSQSASQELFKKIEHLLELTMTSSDQHIYQEEKFDLKPFLDSTINNHPKFKSDPRVHIECPSNLIVKQPPICLYQILEHLLSNAFKFSFKGPIHLKVRTDDSQLYIAVHDTGPGISEVYQKSIFEPFFKIDENLTVGTGLGLTLSQEMAIQLKGKIALKCNDGETIFTLSLPHKKENHD